ncbi:hypothetical protein ACIPPJ_01790 [Streptomyces sp. NPDC086091]|uniref:hypothetical protein n=1 Tax=Streptomyces sp. NPDC086091 TaxID=3365751 RepID=UPI0037FECF01
MDAQYESDTQLLTMHEVPPASTMTEAQRLGECCLWCDVSAARVECGPLYTDERHADVLRPMACDPCRTARLDYLRTHFECRLHIDDCECCVTTICLDAVALVLAHAVAREAAGKPDEVTCAHCHGAGPLKDLTVRPVMWEGGSSLHCGYLHLTPCPSAIPAWLREVAGLPEYLEPGETP